MEVKKMDEIKKDFLCKNIKMVRPTGSEPTLKMELKL